MIAYIKGGKYMAKIITGDDLKNLIEEGKILHNADVKCAEGIKYDFRLGSKLLKSYFGDPIDIEKDLIGPEERNKAVVEPGEVVFVLSKEKIILPKDIYIQLSPKRSLSQDGIELLGGLTVDPLYEGYLVFGLKNVAGKPYKLRVGTKIVGANFFKLSESEAISEDYIPTSIEDFPQRLQELIDKYEPVNPQNLAEELRNLQNAFEDSQSKLTEDVKYLKDQVSTFVQELTKESIKREQETIILTNKVNDVESKVNSLSDNTIRMDEHITIMGTTLNAISGQTKIISEKLIKKQSEKEGQSKITTIIITAVIAVVTTVIGGILLNIFK